MHSDNKGSICAAERKPRPGTNLHRNQVQSDLQQIRTGHLRQPFDFTLGRLQARSQRIHGSIRIGHGRIWPGFPESRRPIQACSGLVGPLRASCGHQVIGRRLGLSEKPSQSAHVVRDVRHRDGGLGAGQPDGPDRQPHPGLLVGEDVLDLRPVLRLAPVGLRGPRGHRAAARLLAVDAAVRPVLLQPFLVLRRAVRRVRPHIAAGVAEVDQAFAKPLAVVRGGG